MSAPKNALEQRLNKTSQEAGQPSDTQDRIGYGIITEIDHDTSQVKIKLLKADGEPGEDIPGGFLPLLNSLEEIHSRFGGLTTGLVCRVFWRGKLQPKNALVEVIANEGHSFLKKKPATNKIDLGPYAIFSGGMA